MTLYPSEVSTIKNKILAFIQKLVLVVLAVLMLLFVIPVGLFRTSDSVEKKGEFIKLFPYEVKSALNDNGQTVEVGKGRSAVLKFDLNRLSEVKAEDIKEVKLRLSFIKGSGVRSNAVSVGIISDDDVRLDSPLPMSYFDFSAVITPQTFGGENSLYEIDLTEHIRRKAKDKRPGDIFLGISSVNTVSVRMASSAYSDPSCRPYLKIVTGMASAEDVHTLAKAELSDAVYVSESRPDTSGTELSGKSGGIVCSEGNDVYIRFNLNRAAIEGTLYKARLSLTAAEGSGEIEIHCLNNNQWSGSGISYSNRPEGEEAQLSTLADGETHTLADVTQEVCEAYVRGADSLTFKITAGSGTNIKFFGIGDSISEPKLHLSCTDDSDIVCASDAALNALGGNGRSFVTTDLTDIYSGKNGSFAKLSWHEYDMNGMRRTGRYLSSSGRISRPKWFEGNAEIIARARITSGDYVTVRRYRLIVQAEAQPDYSKYSFENYIDIGNGQSENKQRFDSVNTGKPIRRSVGGTQNVCRVPMNGGSMLLNFSCIPQGVNYLTLKLAVAEDKSMHFSIVPCDGTWEPFELELPEFSDESDGFIYLTYALPEDFTRGLKYVSLRLMSESARGKDTSSCGIYAVYLTQSPSFDPHDFSSQGEALAVELKGDKEQFIKNAYAFPKDGSSLPPYDAENTAVTDEKADLEKVIVSEDMHTVIFDGDSANIAFLLGDTADIYERCSRYDRLCRRVPVERRGDMLTVDFDEYLMCLNSGVSDSGMYIPEGCEKYGIYREIIGGAYYVFAEDMQTVDYSAAPAEATVLDIGELKIPAGGAVLLKRIESESRTRGWRVTSVNGKSVSELSLENGELLSDITVRAVDGVSENAESLCVVCALYNGGRLISMHRMETGIIQSRDIYTLDISSYGIYMKDGGELRIFAADDSEELNKLQPKVIYP